MDRLLIATAVTAAALICASCDSGGGMSQKPPETSDDATRSGSTPFGHSFVVVTADPKNSDKVFTKGYFKIANGRSQVYSPGAVLVVGDRAGFDVGGKKYGYGTIIVVEGDADRPKYRSARAEDVIVLNGKVKIFGQEYGPGPFTVPAGGILAGTAKP